MLTCLVLAGCGAPGPTAPLRPSLPDPQNDTCGARDYANLIGQDATALERVLIMRQVRVIRPGQAITMDFNSQRINFSIDGAGKIASIGCY